MKQAFQKTTLENRNQKEIIDYTQEHVWLMGCRLFSPDPDKKNIISVR